MNFNTALNPKYFIIAVFVGMIIYIAYVILSPKKKVEETPVETPEEVAEPEFVATPAVVIDKHIDIYHSGPSKYGKHNVAHIVKFLVDGEEREIVVDAATFERVYEGEASTLVMEGDEFFDFSNGEEIDEAELAEYTDTDETIDEE